MACKTLKRNGEDNVLLFLDILRIINRKYNLLHYF